MGTTQFIAAGVSAGDDVVVPAYGGAEVAEAVRALEARPVFADIDPLSFCLDPASVEAVVTPRTTAVATVPLFGHPADMVQFDELAQRHGLQVVNWGPGLQELTVDATRRGQYAAYLNRRLTGVVKPFVAEGVEHLFTDYVVRVPGNGRPDRDVFKRALTERGVECHVPVKTPVYRMPGFFSEVRLPETEKATDEALALPLQAWMTKKDLQRIVSACNALGGLLMEPAC